MARIVSQPRERPARTQLPAGGGAVGLKRERCVRMRRRGRLGQGSIQEVAVHLRRFDPGAGGTGLDPVVSNAGLDPGAGDTGCGCMHAFFG